MDIIERSIEKKKHISSNNSLNQQTWKDFEKGITNKKVFMFGGGLSAGLYFKRYGDSIILEGIVDNDKRKQGFNIDELIAEALGLDAGGKKITDISLFDEYNKNEIVVLITSVNYYEEIIAQLERLEIKNYFVLLIMEANRRKSLNLRIAVDEEIELEKEKIRFANQCCQEKKIDRKKVLFKSYADYSDHGKYITEALLKTGEDLDIVWSVSDLRTIVPNGVRKVYERNWKRFIDEMETSKIWIFDLPIPEYIIKRRGQIYIQTKHWSSITLKKFYLDASTFQEVPEKIKVWKREKELIDHIITGSDFDTKSCRRGFEFQGEILQYGSPRSDGLFHEMENKRKVYDYYHLNKNSKLLIYTPTYRFSKTEGKTVPESRSIGLNFELVKRTLEKRFGGDWYILVRLHPSLASSFQKVKKPDFVIDTSQYGDSQELVSASDILVSDFSSIMFEAAYVGKPVFLFATDLQDYISNEYELLIPYHELPFPVAESNEELEHNIMEINVESYQEEVKKFLGKYGVCEDGHASDRVAQFIVQKI